jgi:hypothetical protein
MVTISGPFRRILIDDPKGLFYVLKLGVSLGVIHDRPLPNRDPDICKAVLQIILDWIHSEISASEITRTTLINRIPGVPLLTKVRST